LHFNKQRPQQSRQAQLHWVHGSGCGSRVCEIFQRKYIKNQQPTATIKAAK